VLHFRTIVNHICASLTPSQLALLRRIRQERSNGSTVALSSDVTAHIDNARRTEQADLQRLIQIGLLEHNVKEFVLTILASQILDGSRHFSSTPIDFLSKHSSERLLTECLVRAVTLGSFPLTKPGPEAQYYFDLDTFISEPGWHRDALLRVLEITVRLMQEVVGVQALACRIPMSGLIGTHPLVFAMSERIGIPFSVNWLGQRFWKGKSSLGWKPDIRTKKNHCVIFHDVLSSGVSLAELIAELSEAGASVVAALCIFDREEGALPYLASRGYHCISLISYSELHALANSSALTAHLPAEKINEFRDTFGQRTEFVSMGKGQAVAIDVAVMQIRSAIQAGGNYRFGAAQQAKQLETIQTRLDHVLQAGNVDVLVFPELSVPYSALDYLQGIAKKHKSWIIAGMEYDNLKQNKCVIIPPFGEPISQAKLTLSPYDDRRMIRGYQQWILSQTGFGDFAVVVCIDLLQSPLIADFRNRLDVLFIISYNAATKFFVDKAISLAIELHCFVVLANVANFGSSAVFAPIKGKNKVLLRLPRKRAAVGSAHLDILQLRDASNTSYYTRLMVGSRDGMNLNQKP
jgi:orotate phosphoribosyltransferase/predicted amidohydrolase